MGKKSREKQARREADRERIEATRAALGRQKELAEMLRLLPEPLDERARASCAAAVAEAARLRQAGQLQAALDLAGAGRCRTNELAAEEALAAFALGLDDRAEAAAAAVPALKSFFAPLLAAARGRPVRASKKTNAAARETTRAAKVLAAIRGNDLRKALREWNAAPFQVLPSATLRAAVSAETESRPHAEDWAPLWRDLPSDLSRLAAMTVGARLSRLFLDDRAPDLPMPWDDIAMMSAVGANGTRDLEQLAELIADLDPKILPEDQRALCLLYAGFGLLESSPEEAVEHFESALARGANVAESLRGMALAADISARRGVAAKHMLRLAKHLASVPGGIEMAAYAAEDAARMFAAIDDARATEALQLGRSLVEKAGLSDSSLRRCLDAVEVMSMKARDPAAALAKIEALIAEDPTSRAAWDVRIDLARDAEEARTLVGRAFEATRDESFAQEARELAGPTCGALASVIALSWSTAPKNTEPRLSRELAEVHAGLEKDKRDAVDVAIIAILAKMDRISSALARTLEARRNGASWWRPAAALLMRSRADLADTWFDELARDEGPMRAFETTFALALEGGSRAAASRLLNRAASILPSGTIRDAKRAVDRVRNGEFGGALTVIDERLHPEFCLEHPLSSLRQLEDELGLSAPVILRTMFEALEQSGGALPRRR